MNPIQSLLQKILSWWRGYQENQKWREFYAKLDRNAEGKWTKADYIRHVKNVKKMEKKRK